MKGTERILLQLVGVPVYYWCINCGMMFKLQFSKYQPGVAYCPDCGIHHQFNPGQIARMRESNE